MMYWWSGKPRHWTADEGYATGDVLLGLIAQGWTVVNIRRKPHEGKSRMYTFTLARGDESFLLPVLDSPAIDPIIQSIN